MTDLMQFFSAYHPGPFYHGTPAELNPDDLIEPNKYPPSMPDPDIRGAEGGRQPRKHTYFSPRRQYITEYYGPNVYEVEPQGEYTRDPEYRSRRDMFRSQQPLKVVRKVTHQWGLPHEAAAGGPQFPDAFPNPYHGSRQFGGRDDWSHTWFHGTKGADPDLRGGRPLENSRGAGSGWPQPNKLLGTHFSPLHAVAHKFAFGIYPGNVGGRHTPGVPSALVHARLHLHNPAHFPSESHLNIGVAHWAQENYPGWHNPQLNEHLRWNYSDAEGTHRDFSQVPHYQVGGSFEENKDFKRMADQAQRALQWHPELPNILHDWTDDQIHQGHHGITYGNEVEGPGDGTTGPRGFPHSYQDVRHISAIATRPSQIETTHVEHIAAPKTAPQSHEVEHDRGSLMGWHDEDEKWEHGRNGYSSDLNEPTPVYKAVGDYHAEHGGTYPGAQRKVAAAGSQLAVNDYEGQTGNPDHITRTEQGMIPTSAVAHLRGVKGEMPGEHRNRQDADWESFKQDIAENGILDPLFITVDHGQEPRISEGSHRRDTAIELGMSHVPAYIRYYGHAEQQGTVCDRALRRHGSSGGDRWFTCEQGHHHWGAYGAAGLLIRHRGEDGQQRYLLQKRAPGVQHGDTWSIPGGAIGKDETPERGAEREAREEIGSLPRDLKYHHTIVSTDCGDWKYHTVVKDSPQHFNPRGGGETDYETAGTAWHTADEVDDLKRRGELHPGFAASWDKVRRSRGPQIERESARDYWMRHRGPAGDEDDPGEALHELGHGIYYPATAWEHPDWYGARHPETIRQIRKANGNPDAMVTVYRGLPREHREINQGDWVGLSAGYAQGHADSEGRGRYHVIKAQVPARHVLNEGNSLEEWTYNGPDIHHADVHPPRRTAAVIASGQPGTTENVSHFNLTSRNASSVASDGPAKSMMIAFVPPPEVLDHLQEVSAPLGEQIEPRSKMHVTLLYLGEEDDHPAEHVARLPELAAQWAKTIQPFKARLQGAGTFINGDSHVLHGLVDIPRGHHLRSSLEDFLHGHGIHFPQDHNFTPHITIAYANHRMRFLPKIEPHEWEVPEIYYCRGKRWQALSLPRRAGVGSGV